MDSKSVKILFAFQSDLLEQWVNENVWAGIVDEERGWFRLDSIPFYATGVACGDVILAAYSEEQQLLQFSEVVRPSGHSTVQVFVMGSDVNAEVLREELASRGCESEGMSEKFFVVDIPADRDYVDVKAILDEWRSKNMIDYAESCLSAIHYYE